MAKGREIKLPLPAADDLFSTQEERDEAKREFIADIPLTEISDFPDHPYKVKQDESMLELAASIREKGVVNPALVRPKPEGGYEMVAGHRRKFASELAGKTIMPCIVRNLTDDEATIIMVDSNLQREKVLPSEKAFAYKMKLDAMKRQGQRTDLTSTPVEQKLSKYSVEILGEAVGESRSQIQRYIRLPLSTFAGEPTQNVGKSFLKSYAAVCLEGAIIVLACIIFSVFASSPPVVDPEAAAVTMVWSYIAELIFNMLVLVGAVKMADRVVREMMGL